MTNHLRYINSEGTGLYGPEKLMETIMPTIPPILEENSYQKLRRILLVLCSILFFIEYSNLSINNNFFADLGIGLSDPNVVIDFVWICLAYFFIKFIINSQKWSEIDFNKYNDSYFKKTLLPEFDKYFPKLVSYQPGLINSIESIGSALR